MHLEVGGKVGVGPRIWGETDVGTVLNNGMAGHVRVETRVRGGMDPHLGGLDGVSE